MPHRRKNRKGSFAGHFDELVAHFPKEEIEAKAGTREDRLLKDKLDVHAALFEQAWQMERSGR